MGRKRLAFYARITVLCLALFVPISFLCADSDLWTLAEDGISKSIVIVNMDATDTERHAADELWTYLNRITGARIRQWYGPVPDKYGIRVGTPETNPWIEEFGLLDRVNGLSNHGFLIHADERGLVIAARKPLGVLYGVYGFLEEHIGVRWFFPGSGGEYCPEIPSLRIGRIDDLQEPSFSRRTAALTACVGICKTPDSWDWVLRNRMQLLLYPAGGSRRHIEEFRKRVAEERGGGHVLHRMVPDELFEDHPEYFGLYEGERRRQKGHGGQPCTTHSEVVNLAVNFMLDWFRDNPEGIFTLNNNDNWDFCECENCVALDPPEEREKSFVSTRFFTFKNEVAGRVWEVYPDARINTLAYQRFRQPPTGVVPDARLLVTLCDHGRCYRHSLDDPNCEPNEWFRGMFAGWAKFDNQRGIFPYYNMMGRWFIPEGGIVSVPIERMVANDMRYMHGLGHSHWSIRVIAPDAQLQPVHDEPSRRYQWRANFDWTYIQAKLAWDIELDEGELLEDLYLKFYGPAGGPMSAYRARIRELWESTPGHFIYGAWFRTLGRTLDVEGAKEELIALFDEAEAAVRGIEPYHGRVTEDRLIFERSWLLALRLYREWQATSHPLDP